MARYHWLRTLGGAAISVMFALGASAQSRPAPEQVLSVWYELVLDLVRHTPTYTPPVASRTLAYVGVTAYEATASGNDGLISLAGQLNGLTDLPARETGQAYDEATVLQAALAGVVTHEFSNTGPTGQRALAAVRDKLGAAVAEGLPADLRDRSLDHGQAIAAHILAWAATDKGAVVENMGFPQDYPVAETPANWVPTSKISLQQHPLLPDWGQNRPFAMPDGATCDLPPPPDYSEDKGSEFYRQALEVYEVGKSLTPEQKAIALFWADDAMLSRTPPGHWISIALQVLDAEKADMPRRTEALAKLGIAVADAFIGCWNAKYQYDLLRPVTYIRRVIDPNWETLLTTPPFPEYPSGHSTQSGAAATVMTALFGEGHAFDDNTPSTDGLPPRSFASFWTAADEAGISRLYGGIHYRAAIDRGLDQGRCIGAYATALKTRRN